MKDETASILQKLYGDGYYDGWNDRAVDLGEKSILPVEALMDYCEEYVAFNRKELIAEMKDLIDYVYDCGYADARNSIERSTPSEQKIDGVIKRYFPEIEGGGFDE